MFAIVRTTQIKGHSNYTSFIEEVFLNKAKYRVKTQGVVLSFEVNTLEELFTLFATLYNKTKLQCPYVLMKTSCITNNSLKPFGV